jgi:hypothetical protein
MCEDQRADRLASQTLEIAAVPGRDCGGENARLGAKVYLVLLWSHRLFMGAADRSRCGVVADTEAIAIVRAAVIQTEARVVALREDAVGGRGDQVGEQDRRVARIDEEATHDYVDGTLANEQVTAGLGLGWPVGSDVTVAALARHVLCLFFSKAE